MFADKYIQPTSITLEMPTFKVTKKHHKLLNNPFPSSPNRIPFRKGSIFTTSATRLSLSPSQSPKLYPIGNDFHAIWSGNINDDTETSFSIYHNSQPQDPIWSTVPGHAFVSAGCADTEVDECRGSFAVHDRDVKFLCDHQSVDEVRVIADESGLFELGISFDLGFRGFPVWIITGFVFSSYNANFEADEGLREFVEKDSASVRYWVVFHQKSSDQVGFHVKFEKPDVRVRNLNSLNVLNRCPSFSIRMGRLCLPLWRARGFPWSSESEGNDEAENYREINRVWFTYSSKEDERFYGFGEQFSHMNLKGKRVPIFVQEQGIGRGDQPITFAANLASYRYSNISLPMFI